MTLYVDIEISVVVYVFCLWQQVRHIFENVLQSSEDAFFLFLNSTNAHDLFNLAPRMKRYQNTQEHCEIRV